MAKMTIEAKRSMNINPHYARHYLLKSIRDFFNERGFLEVTTPILVRCPGIDPHIDALPAGEGFYLATSPELHMKRLLGSGLKKIYQITHAFRAEEIGQYHQCEFSILEWYETGLQYQELMNFTELFLQTIDQEVSSFLDRPFLFNSPFEKISVDRAFQEWANWSPSQEWDEDRFFRDLIDLVEPKIKNIPATFFYDFPAPLASLAKTKAKNPLQSERFELYVHGLELANGFSELTCGREQRERFERDIAKRITMGKEAYPLDDHFLATLDQGLMPECAGIALGIDRLLMILTEAGQLSEVMAFPS